MKYLAIALVGFIMLMSSVWIGAYGMHNYPANVAWQNFPIFFTSFVFFIAGAFVTLFGLFEYEDYIKEAKRK